MAVVGKFCELVCEGYRDQQCQATRLLVGCFMLLSEDYEVISSVDLPKLVKFGNGSCLELLISFFWLSLLGKVTEIDVFTANVTVIS